MASRLRELSIFKQASAIGFHVGQSAVCRSRNEGTRVIQPRKITGRWSGAPERPCQVSVGGGLRVSRVKLINQATLRDNGANERERVEPITYSCLEERNCPYPEKRHGISHGRQVYNQDTNTEMCWPCAVCPA